MMGGESRELVVGREWMGMIIACVTAWSLGVILFVTVLKLQNCIYIQMLAYPACR